MTYPTGWTPVSLPASNRAGDSAVHLEEVESLRLDVGFQCERRYPAANPCKWLVDGSCLLKTFFLRRSRLGVRQFLSAAFLSRLVELPRRQMELPHSEGWRRCAIEDRRNCSFSFQAWWHWFNV